MDDLTCYDYRSTIGLTFTGTLAELAAIDEVLTEIAGGPIQPGGSTQPALGNSTNRESTDGINTATTYTNRSYTQGANTGSLEGNTASSGGSSSQGSSNSGVTSTTSNEQLEQYNYGNEYSYGGNTEESYAYTWEESYY